jgi:hypothetical protein
MMYWDLIVNWSERSGQKRREAEMAAAVGFEEDEVVVEKEISC